MSYAEIDVRQLKEAIKAILDHVVEDLGIEKLGIDEDFYWDIAESALYDFSKNPTNVSIGSLVDDVEFSKNVQRGAGADNTLNLVHIWPQLRYVVHKLKK